MIKYKLIHLSLALLIFSTNTYAIKIMNQIKKDEVPKIENFQDYKEYRIKQLSELKQLGIVDDKFIESEIKIMKTFEENKTKIKFIRDGSRINELMCFDFNESFIEDFEKINRHYQELICKIN